MLNSVKNHLTFELKDQDSKSYKYIITCTSDSCNECNDNKSILEESNYVITLGTDKFNESWKKICINHINTISVKKQYCNICNKKSKINDRLPKLCNDCYQYLYDNHIELHKVCKIPILSIEECNCKFCKMR